MDRPQLLAEGGDSEDQAPRRRVVLVGEGGWGGVGGGFLETVGRPQLLAQGGGHEDQAPKGRVV